MHEEQLVPTEAEGKANTSAAPKQESQETEGPFEPLNMDTLDTVLRGVTVQDTPLTPDQKAAALAEINTRAEELKTSPIGLMYQWLENLKNRQKPIPA